MAQILYDIKKTIGPEQNIDAALVVLKLTDYRTSIQEMYAIKTISTMIENASPKNTFMILTHCDLLKPTEKLIQGKRDSFMRFGPLEIQHENVVEFDNSTKSLEKFIEKIQPSNMHFHEKLEEKAKIIGEELPGDFKRQDAAENTQNSEIHRMALEIEKLKNEKL